MRGVESSGKKVLAVGESHYCGTGCADCGVCGRHPECADFTSKVVEWCLDPSVEREGWMNTYLKFERLFASLHIRQF